MLVPDDVSQLRSTMVHVLSLDASLEQCGLEVEMLRVRETVRRACSCMLDDIDVPGWFQVVTEPVVAALNAQTVSWASIRLMAEGLEDFVEVLSYWSSNHLVAEVFDKFHANARNLLAQFTTSVEAMVRFQFEQSNSTKQAVKPTAGPGIQGTREDNHGFVGLINLGNICYITACIQQLYMSPPFAEAILSINDTLARTTDLHHLDEAAKVRPSDLQVFSEVAAIFQILATSSQRSADPAKLIEAFSQLPLSYNVYELGNAEESMRLLLDRGYEV